jgi:hypothetical protein
LHARTTAGGLVLPAIVVHDLHHAPRIKHRRTNRHCRTARSDRLTVRGTRALSVGTCARFRGVALGPFSDGALSELGDDVCATLESNDGLLEHENGLSGGSVATAVAGTSPERIP